ncbi:family 16 glycosylhydrolase [Flagellimonas sp.]|uniref:family 16 glycosylhydrolase n=1 Tax=Flagellimonas sp. TaxID=2058762 RepID=UPI003B520F2E
MKKRIVLFRGICLLFLGFISYGSLAQESSPYPFSDPSNEGGWVLNEDLSDDFEGTELDPNKWFVEGQNGDYYIWKGRPPSQFVPHNVIVEDGKLKLRTQWEADYKFANENYADGNNNDKYGEFEGKPLPVTTAGVLTKKRFLYGYMEVKSKVGNAAITGAFWAIGYEQELDVYELMGNPKIAGNIRADSYLATAHDWSPPAIRPTKVFNHIENLPFRTADDFHVYGAEWGKDYLKLFIDGKIVHQFTQDDVGTDWVLNNPMEVWLDSEIFKWLGLPHKEELPVDFEIEYMRVWQKPDDNLVQPAFYGFEGPVLYEENPRPLKMVPEDSTPNDYQKFWLIDEASSKYLSIVHGDYATGVNSLKFSGFGKNEKLETEKVVALSPEGAINIPAGDYTLSFKVWLDQGRITKKIYLSMENPKLEIPIDLTGLGRRQWVTIEKKFSKKESSSANDQFKIEIRKTDVPKIKAVKFYIDDIAIRPTME